MTLRRYVGALVWVSVVASYNVVAAQVGHEPAHSPYHDVRRGGVLVFTFGNLGGSRGSVGVGPSDGKTGGIRYEVPFGAVGASLGLAYARMDRFVVDPFTDTTSRKTGPFTDDVVLLDAGLQLILTGRKTWRGFAPYVGGGLGGAIRGTCPRATTGGKFGSEVTRASQPALPQGPPHRPRARVRARSPGGVRARHETVLGAPRRAHRRQHRPRVSHRGGGAAALRPALAPRPARRSGMALHMAGDRGGRRRARPPHRRGARGRRGPGRRSPHPPHCRHRLPRPVAHGADRGARGTVGPRGGGHER